MHDLVLSNSTVHSSNKISARKGQGWKSVLDARYLWVLRQNCNKTDLILLWTSLYGVRNISSSKSLSVNTVCHVKHKCGLKLCYAKRKPYDHHPKSNCHPLWVKEHLKFCGQMNRNLKLFFENNRCHVLVQKRSYYQPTVQKPTSITVPVMSPLNV